MWILLAVMVLAFSLLPGTASASSASLDVAATDTVVDSAGGLASVAPVELGRQHPDYKLVCERTRDLSAVVCTRWAPHKCKVPRGEEVGMQNCMGNGPRARVIL